MKRVLLTGISGTGKSTLAAALTARGYHAVDADSDDWSEWAAVDAPSDKYGTPVEPDRDWVWREERIEALLAQERGDALFLCGCAANMGRFLPAFDAVVLLTAPHDVIAHRLATRTTNPYGKAPAEAARVLQQKSLVEPTLRRVATREIDTRAPLEQIVADVLDLL